MIIKTYIDELLLLKGNDYVVSDKLKVKHPTLGEIVEYGEQEYFQAINMFIVKPYDMMVALDEMGLDYRNITQYELFLMMFNPNQIQEYQRDFKWLLNIDCDFVIAQNKDNDEIVLYSENQGIVIDRYIHAQISNFLKRVNFVPEKDEFNPKTKQAYKSILEEKKKEIQRSSERKKNEYESVLSNIISSTCWSGDSAVNPQNVWDLHIYQLYDGFHRIQKKSHYKNIMQGIYTGNIDSEKINLRNIDWTAKYNN